MRRNQGEKETALEKADMTFENWTRQKGGNSAGVQRVLRVPRLRAGAKHNKSAFERRERRKRGAAQIQDVAKLGGALPVVQEGWGL